MNDQLVYSQMTCLLKRQSLTCCAFRNKNKKDCSIE